MAAGMSSSAVPGALSLLEVTVTPVIVSPSIVTSTVIGPAKPSAVPVRPPEEGSSAGAAYFCAALTALTTALVLIVAPVIASTFSPTARSPLLSTSWTRKSQSLEAFMPRP